MATSPERQLATMIENLPEKTGKSLEEWLELLSKETFTKHGEAMKILKGEHGVTHGFANLIASKALTVESNDEKSLVDIQYKGDKAGLREIYEELIRVAESLGTDVEASPKKTYVSLRRNKQFALIQPSTKTRVDLGLNLKGKATTKRLEESGSFNAMVSHRVRFSEKSEVNAEVKAWLKEAYTSA